MIKPNVRASFGRAEAEFLLSLAGPDGEERLRERGLDALLDDAAVARALLQRGGVGAAPAPLVFYLLVRHSMLEREVFDRRIADYTAALLLEFGNAGRAHRVERHDPEQLFYLVDVLQEMARARGEREFQLRVHLGNFALWLAGVFPDYVTARVQRRGAPPLSYYDEMGASGFRSAAGTEMALRHGMGELFLQMADEFSNVRSALNSLSDALFFPHSRDAVDRLLRQVKDDFERGG